MTLNEYLKTIVQDDYLDGVEDVCADILRNSISFYHIDSDAKYFEIDEICYKFLNDFIIQYHNEEFFNSVSINDICNAIYNTLKNQSEIYEAEIYSADKIPFLQAYILDNESAPSEVFFI